MTNLLLATVVEDGDGDAMARTEVAAMVDD